DRPRRRAARPVRARRRAGRHPPRGRGPDRGPRGGGGPLARPGRRSRGGPLPRIRGDRMSTPAGGFQPPVYPYERLAPALQKASAHPGGIVDLSIGTPTDPPPAVVLDVLARADELGSVRGYPASAGSEELLLAAAAWEKER